MTEEEKVKTLLSVFAKRMQEQEVVDMILKGDTNFNMRIDFGTEVYEIVMDVYKLEG